MNKPTSIDDYLSNVPPDRKAALEKLRQQIHALAPDAVECISYSMPAFRCATGKVFAGFLATTKGCSYYPFSGTTLGTLADDLAAYDQTKSALHFDPARGLPKTLVRKLIAARMAEIDTPKRPAQKRSDKSA